MSAKNFKRKLFPALRYGIVLFLCSSALPQAAEEIKIPRLYLVRHAEKLAGWPDDGAFDAFQPLSATGVARAQKLAEQFHSGAIAAIFSSRTTRSLHTALPLAQKLNLTIEVVAACMDTAAIASFYKKLAQRFKADQAVVLVSHSNIIPYLLIKAGLPASCFKEMQIKASSPASWLLIEGYDSVWKVEPGPLRKKTCQDFSRRQY
jgi:broad specificity phosphatase PhoE